MTRASVSYVSVGYSGVHTCLTTLKRWKTQCNCTFACSLLMTNQIVSLRGVDIGIFIILGRTGGLALFPGSWPHYCHLQYGKSGEGLDNISFQ